MRGICKIFCISLIVIVAVPVFTQQKTTSKKKYVLESDVLKQQGKELDREIALLNNKISNVITKYDLINTKNIRIIPYRTSYDLGKDFIKIEKHRFIKTNIIVNNIAGIGDVIGIRTKSIKFIISGGKVTRVESKIYERFYNSGETTEVLIVDPSPGTEDVSDMIFTHIYKGRVFLDKKKLGDVKNTTASSLRNQLKREFVVPHLNAFYDTVMFVAQAHYKSLKDADQNMSEFLKKSAKFQ